MTIWLDLKSNAHVEENVVMMLQIIFWVISCVEMIGFASDRETFLSRDIWYQMNVCTYGGKNVSSRLRRKHISFSCYQLNYPLLGCHTPYLISVWYCLLNESSFSDTSTVYCSHFCLDLSLSISFSTAPCVKLIALPLPLVSAAFPSHLLQFLWHLLLNWWWWEKLILEAAVGKQSSLQPLPWETKPVYCMFSTHTTASNLTLSQVIFFAHCFFCLKLHCSEEVSLYKRLLRK